MIRFWGPRILFLGFGNVGRRVVEILADPAKYPRIEDLGDYLVVGIVTRSHGATLNPRGLDLKRVLEEWNREGRFRGEVDAATAIRETNHNLVVEMTPLDIPGRGAEAIRHIRLALEDGSDVITCNKGPVAWAWHELRELAYDKGRGIVCETTVMDGVPVFNLVQRSLKGNRILKLEGILNSTTNYVLGEMEKGVSLEEAVAGAQRLGVAEADPTYDLEGWDAAVKVAALANVLFRPGAELRPEKVERDSLRSVTPERIREAAARGARLKVVCETWRESYHQVTGRVKIREIPLTDPFALVSGTSSILRVTTDIAGKIVITEEDPDLSTTAYGVISDLFRLREGF
jgi:homoserine dehydrogenase